MKKQILTIVTMFLCTGGVLAQVNVDAFQKRQQQMMQQYNKTAEQLRLAATNLYEDLTKTDENDK